MRFADDVQLDLLAGTGMRAHVQLRRCAWLVIACFAFAAAAFPQEPGPLKTLVRPRATLTRPSTRMDVNMVLVPLSVVDQGDRPVTDLTAKSFRVFEDEIEQSVLSLHREEGPVSVGLIVDASASMKKRIQTSAKAMEQFFKTAVPGDEFFLVRFSDHPEVLSGFTGDGGAILSEMSAIRPEGWTSLNDAICLGVHQMKSAKNSRRALLVLTDGGDNNSRYSESEVRALVREADVRVYSIGLFDRPRFLERLGDDTGGRAFYVHDIDALPKTVDRLSETLRNQYVLGYATQNPHNDGKYRKVRVELLEAMGHLPLHVFWRRGYFAPSD